MLDAIPVAPKDHDNVVHKVLRIAAWTQVLLVVGGVIAGALLLRIALQSRRRRHSAQQ